MEQIEEFDPDFDYETGKFKEPKKFESVGNALIDKFESLEKKFIKGVEMKNCKICKKERINAMMKEEICFACNQS